MNAATQTSRTPWADASLESPRTEPWAPRFPGDLEPKRRAEFARKIDALGRKYAAKVGEEDLDYIHSVDRLSKRMTLLGRALIHFSLDPVTFAAGVGALWVGKQLNLTEVAHHALHGAYDRLVPDDGPLHSNNFQADAPIEPKGWKYSHNVLHHSFTNIVGKDPDSRFGVSRLNEQVPPKPYHRFQMVDVVFNWLHMAPNLNAQVTGLLDFYLRAAGDGEVLPNRSWRSVLEAHWRHLRVQVPYSVVNYGLIPALAGPFFPKVLAGNLLAETMRNVFTAVAIYCGHIGGELAYFPKAHHAQGKADWYLQQIAATKNFDVGPRVSQLVGALDRQIEHHLFPKLPPNRLRELSPELQALCEEYAVPYHTAPWLEAIRQMVARAIELSRPASQRLG